MIPPRPNMNRENSARPSNRGDQDDDNDDEVDDDEDR